MFIQTEPTPNPATLKFLPGCDVLPGRSVDFTDPEQAETASPLARRIFAVEGVKGVYLAGDFVSVTKGEREAAAADESDPTIRQIKELLETRVRPAVARDGGDIVFHGFERGVVYLHMQGACSGCPSSMLTLKSGIENLLRYYVPEVTEVRAID